MSQAPSRPAVVNGVDLDAVAAAVRACAGVDDLDGGPVNARLATYLPGRALDGLKVTDELVIVQIRGVWGIPVTTVAEQIRMAVAHLVLGRTVDIIVADLTPAPGYQPEPEPEPAAPTADVAEAQAPNSTPQPDPPQTQDTTPPVPVVTEPVVVERTVSVTEKVVQDDVAAEAAAALSNQPAPPQPARTVGPVETAEPRPSGSEGDSVVWVTATPTGPTTPSADVSDVSTSAPTIPTPAAIPPRS